MKQQADQIPLLRSFTDYVIFVEDVALDLHNDYECLKIVYDGTSLSLEMKSIREGHDLEITFEDVAIQTLSCLTQELQDVVTIDQLYRGSWPLEDRLIDLDDRRRGYFYLDFVSGVSLEFWTRSVEVTSTSLRCSVRF